MSNYPISHGKTLYDIFNMMNPNCYQALIMQYIIENRKEDALKCCNELSVAFDYYKWDKTSKQSDYLDSLVCESSLEKWQKIAIIHIMSNNVDQCKKVISNEIESENNIAAKRLEHAKMNSRSDYTSDLYRLFGSDPCSLQ